MRRSVLAVVSSCMHCAVELLVLLHRSQYVRARIHDAGCCPDDCGQDLLAIAFKARLCTAMLKYLHGTTAGTSSCPSSACRGFSSCAHRARAQ